MTSSHFEGKQVLIAAAGAPLDPERVYTVAIDFLLLTGLNDNKALINYGKEHPRMMANKDSCAMAKETLIAFFATQLLNEMGGQSDNSVTSHLSYRESARGHCLVASPPSGRGEGGSPSATSRCGSLLPSVSADVRSSDDVIACCQVNTGWTSMGR